MSRIRLKEKLRTNHDLDVISAELDRLGLPWSVVPPNGKGHPIMLIEIAGVTHRRPIPCTPRRNTPRVRILSSLRRWLRDRAIGV